MAETNDFRIMVWHGKHDPMFFDASTPAAWAESCVYLLTIMDREMQFYYEWDIPTIVSSGAIEAMPAHYQGLALQDQKRDAKNAKEALDNNRLVKEIHRIIAEHDISVCEVGRVGGGRLEPVAWYPLWKRSTYEYERVVMETVHCV